MVNIPDVLHASDAFGDACVILSEHDRNAVLAQSDGSRWVRVEPCRSGALAVSAYGHACCEDRLLRSAAGGADVVGIARASDGDLHAAFSMEGQEQVVRFSRGTDDDALRAVVDHSPWCASSAATAPEHRLADVLASLRLGAGFLPDRAPLALSDIAAAATEADAPVVRSARSLGTARERSVFPFHEMEALSGAGPLAAADALDAVRSLRDALATADEVFAERWGKSVHLDMQDETTLFTEHPALPAFVFSPEAHMLGDWLQVSPAEVAEGRGNLVVLARRWSTSPEVRADEDGEVSPVHPLTADRWYLYVVDRGTVRELRLADA